MIRSISISNLRLRFIMELESSLVFWLPLFLLCIVYHNPVLAQQCKLGVIPDQSVDCTPGKFETNDINQICGRTSGGTYSQTHRLSQTPETKHQVMSRYGVPWGDRSKYEDDHDGPLCLGGSDSIANRWPQTRSGDWPASKKDRLETESCKMVCAGQVSVDEAQSWFLAPADWRIAYCKQIGEPEGDESCELIKY